MTAPTWGRFFCFTVPSVTRYLRGVEASEGPTELTCPRPGMRSTCNRPFGRLPTGRPAPLASAPSKPRDRGAAPRIVMHGGWPCRLHRCRTRYRNLPGLLTTHRTWPTRATPAGRKQMQQKRRRAEVFLRDATPIIVESTSTPAAANERENR